MVTDGCVVGEDQSGTGLWSDDEDAQADAEGLYSHISLVWLCSTLGAYSPVMNLTRDYLKICGLCSELNAALIPINRWVTSGNGSVISQPQRTMMKLHPGCFCV